MIAGWLDCELSPAMQQAFQSTYGVLQTLFLSSMLPSARRFFTARRWGGYLDDSARLELIQSPAGAATILAVWIAAAAIALGDFAAVGAAVNFGFCYFYFIALRWRSLQRGFGAPGFISFWGSAAVLLLTIGQELYPTLLPLIALVLQVDFAFVLFSAGWYKLRSGYAAGEGMEYGLANPQWGRFWRSVRDMAPTSFWLTASNRLAWSVELLAAALMLIPGLRWIGGLLLMVSFLYVGVLVRLGMLAPMVMICGMLFLTAGSPLDRLLPTVVAKEPPAGAWAVAHPSVQSTFEAALWIYLALRPLAQAGLMINFYGRRRLPGLLQPVLEQYTNLFGIILWKVFASDLTRFWVQISGRLRNNGVDRPASTWGRFGRYGSVVESIAVTCVFTSRQYFASRPEIFYDRLLAYARTIPCRPDEILLFNVYSIVKREDRFEHLPIEGFLVDVPAGIIERQAAEGAPSPPDDPLRREAVRPGSYLPLDSIR